MHVEINPNRMVGIRVVTFRRKDENIGEFGVTIQCTNTLYDVPIEDFKSLACNDDFATNKLRPSRGELLVNDLVELSGVLVRQPQ